MPQRSKPKVSRGTKALADVLDAVVKPKPNKANKPKQTAEQRLLAIQLEEMLERRAATADALGKPMGRPPKFKKEYITQAKKLAGRDFTDQELADFFEVTKRTLDRWKLQHPDFCLALKMGKELPDERVKRSLYQMAVGYEQDVVKVMQHEGQVVYAPYRERVAPSPAAAIFWLKNRLPDEFRDKQDVEHKVSFSLVELVAMSGLTTSAPHPSLLTDGAKDPDVIDSTAMRVAMEQSK